VSIAFHAIQASLGRTIDINFFFSCKFLGVYAEYFMKVNGNVRDFRVYLGRRKNEGEIFHVLHAMISSDDVYTLCPKGKMIRGVFTSNVKQVKIMDIINEFFVRGKSHDI